ncbi:hypothetical protein PAMA_001006 [Pampus argenteus]
MKEQGDMDMPPGGMKREPWGRWGGGEVGRGGEWVRRGCHMTPEPIWVTGLCLHLWPGTVSSTWMDPAVAAVLMEYEAPAGEHACLSESSPLREPLRCPLLLTLPLYSDIPWSLGAAWP